MKDVMKLAMSLMALALAFAFASCQTANDDDDDPAVTAQTEDDSGMTSSGGSGQSYTVTFDTDGGCVVASQTVASGKSALLPAPARQRRAIILTAGTATADAHPHSALAPR